jgi:hypothetical protein
MPEEQSLNHLMSRMVAQYFPAEQELWDISGTSWTHELYTTGGIKTQKQKGGDFEFIPTPDQVHMALEVMSALIGTFKAFKIVRELLREGKSPGREALVETWAKHLNEHGISKAKADKISAVLYDDFKRLAEGKH